ncbi:hypothetical protein CYQ88_00340 [Hydrogenovibrio sp. SC-1]|uniref:DUF4870 family protein n=1 Tax=Hydrogenovibrio sp. SC-1 TaxID=2065820 RepID=UPI000C7E4A0C|nr:hypothetical protein [Hydrogenovibrio sp. SC-1]PLA75451.1 hypothetical protein CYQ88_00340 [Hydrogenovibrio sp. SC-1]
MESNDTERINGNYAKAVYIIYLLGLLFPITALIGLIIAIIKRGEIDSPAWLEQHYRFQIQTFWFGLIYLLVGFFFTAFIIGWLILCWWLIWLIIRSVKGLNAIDKQVGIRGGFFSSGTEILI